MHAGDLSQYGTFNEIQAQLSWLSAQTHEHKIVVAGNHDLLLDKVFVEAHPIVNLTVSRASGARTSTGETFNTSSTAVYVSKLQVGQVAGYFTYLEVRGHRAWEAEHFSMGRTRPSPGMV